MVGGAPKPGSRDALPLDRTLHSASWDYRGCVLDSSVGGYRPPGSLPQARLRDAGKLPGYEPGPLRLLSHRSRSVSRQAGEAFQRFAERIYGNRELKAEKSNRRIRTNARRTLAACRPRRGSAFIDKTHR